MREEKNIKELLKKFVRNECSDVELRKVVEYFRARTGSSDFLTVEEVIEAIDSIPEMDPSSADRIYNKIISVSEQKKTIHPVDSYRKPYIWRYAAAIAVLFVIAAGYIVWQNMFATPGKEQLITQVDGVLTPPEEAITLKREDGKLEIIHPDGSRKVTDAQGNVIVEQKNGVLIYEGENKIEELVHNTLTIPYGKRFKVVLSDGTSVHLNAGSSLKYPVKFLENEDYREVFVTGEAFFDVAQDTEYPFIVNTGEMNVRVLGTQFNVSSYLEDEATDVVLVEGSVHLFGKDPKKDGQSQFILEPGEKGRFDRRDHKISKQRVVTSIYTAWMNGELVFRNMAFEDILRKLERHYNISIQNQNEALAKEKFNASFGDEPLEKVLDNLKTIYGIDFTIEDNQVIVQ